MAALVCLGFLAFLEGVASSKVDDSAILRQREIDKEDDEVSPRRPRRENAFDLPGVPKDDSVPLQAMQDEYLATVRMGLLGGLAHAAETNPGLGATTDKAVRGQCLERDWKSNEVIDNCIMKWDGNERMLRIDEFYKSVKEHDVPGDLVECGVFRGGNSIYMAAMLKAYGDASRKVWVADSFTGGPDALQQADNSDEEEDVEKSDTDKEDGHPVNDIIPTLHKVFKAERSPVEEQLVRNNFARFDLLDEDHVIFLPGKFQETLPDSYTKGLKHISILRLDGDGYATTKEVLKLLYPRVPSGGYIMIDRYAEESVHKAVLEFFKTVKLEEGIIKTDRITEEKKAKYAEFDNINTYAYFRKP
jgi:hypothetical protein